MMHEKAILKPGIGEIGKATRGISSWPHKGGLQHPIWISSCKGQRADVRWVIAYSHKTQFFMKKWGQQKCLDKSLHH